MKNRHRAYMKELAAKERRALMIWAENYLIHRYGRVRYQYYNDGLRYDAERLYRQKFNEPLD